MICKKCSKKLREDIGICPYCGTKTNEIVENNINNNINTNINIDNLSFDLEGLKMNTIGDNTELDNNKFVLNEEIIDDEELYTNNIENDKVISEIKDTLDNNSFDIIEKTPSNYESINIDYNFDLETSNIKDYNHSFEEENNNTESLTNIIDNIETVNEDTVETDLLNNNEMTNSLPKVEEENNYKYLDESILNIKIEPKIEDTTISNTNMDELKEIIESNFITNKSKTNITETVINNNLLETTNVESSEIVNNEQLNDVDKLKTEPIDNIDVNNNTIVTHDMNKLLESDTVDIENTLKEATNIINTNENNVTINNELKKEEAQINNIEPVKTNKSNNTLLYILIGLFVVAIAILTGYLITK